MARRDEGKTATTRKRMVKVYFSSFERLNAWRSRAETLDVSLSRLLLEKADLGMGTASSHKDVDRIQELDRQNATLREKLEKAQERNDQLDRLLKYQDRDLKQLRTSHAPASRPGRKRFRSDLLRLLVERQAVQDRDIYQELGIRPTDPEAVRVTEQLELLERGNVVERTGNGWRLKDILRDRTL